MLESVDEAPVNSRANALKQCEPPVRIGSRQQSATDNLTLDGDSKSEDEKDKDKAASGSGSEEEKSADEAPASMGEASLRVLVKALVQQGKTQYLVIRNALQRPEYFGRALTREEKQTISDILQDSMNEKEDITTTTTGSGSSSSSSTSTSKPPVRQHSQGGQNQSSYRRSNSKGMRRRPSRGISRGLSRCNSTSSSSDRPPLARAPSTGGYGAARLTLTERLSTTERLSLTTDRLSLNKSSSLSRCYSRGSSFGTNGDYDYHDENEYGDGHGGDGGNSNDPNQDDEYSLFAHEPMRVSDCLAPVTCP